MDNLKYVPRIYGDKNVASLTTGLSAELLKRWRLDGRLKKNIHWISLAGGSKVLYCLPLLVDYLKNIEFPKEHEKAIQAFMVSPWAYVLGKDFGELQ